jgi:hypothetical protein
MLWDAPEDWSLADFLRGFTFDERQHEHETLWFLTKMLVSNSDACFDCIHHMLRPIAFQ